MPGLKDIFLDLRTLALDTVVYQNERGIDVKPIVSEMWNEQYIESETGNERAFNYPCIFIDFPEEIEYESLGRGAVQTEELRIRLYFVMEYLKPRSNAFPENLNIFTAREAIIKAFNLFLPPSGAAQNALEFITDRRNSNNTNLWIWEFDFKCWYREDAGFIDQDQIEVTGVEICTEQSLQIKESTKDNIRTDSEII